MRKICSFETLIFIVILVIGGDLSFAYSRGTENIFSVYIGIFISFVVARLSCNPSCGSVGKGRDLAA